MSGNSDKTILVTGITGQQGGAVARRLHADGWRVRGLTRDPEATRHAPLRELGVELVAATSPTSPAWRRPWRTSTASLPWRRRSRRAWRTRSPRARHWATWPPRPACGTTSTRRWARPTRRPASPTSSPRRAIEEHLKGLDLPLTIVRPVYFMENFVTWATQRTDEGLVVAVPLRGTTPLQMIAVDDIAAIVGIVFAQPEQVHRQGLRHRRRRAHLPEAAAIAGRRDRRAGALRAGALGGRCATKTRTSTSCTTGSSARATDVDIDDVRKMYPELLDLRAWVARGGARPLTQRRAA